MELTTWQPLAHQQTQGRMKKRPFHDLDAILICGSEGGGGEGEPPKDRSGYLPEFLVGIKPFNCTTSLRQNFKAPCVQTTEDLLMASYERHNVNYISDTLNHNFLFWQFAQFQTIKKGWKPLEICFTDWNSLKEGKSSMPMLWTLFPFDYVNERGCPLNQTSVLSIECFLTFQAF